MQLYIAEVMSTDDKDENNVTQKIGRVQIYCAPIHHNIKEKAKDLLPWAQSASCFTSMVPPVGAFVWVFFEKEEYFKNPFYIAPVNFSSLNGHNENIGSMTADYPHVKYMKFANDVAIAFSDDDNKPEISIYHPKAEIYIEKDGHTTIHASNHTNKIDMNNDGIKVTDKNNNIITMDNVGIDIKDKNSNEIKMTSSVVEIKSSSNAVEKMFLGETTKTELDKIKNLLQAIQTAFTTWVVNPMDGGAALKATSAGFVSLPLPDTANVLSTKTKNN